VEEGGDGVLRRGSVRLRDNGLGRPGRQGRGGETREVRLGPRHRGADGTDGLRCVPIPRFAAVRLARWMAAGRHRADRRGRRIHHCPVRGRALRGNRSPRGGPHRRPVRRRLRRRPDVSVVAAAGGRLYRTGRRIHRRVPARGSPRWHVPGVSDDRRQRRRTCLVVAAGRITTTTDRPGVTGRRQALDRPSAGAGGGEHRPGRWRRDACRPGHGCDSQGGGRRLVRRRLRPRWPPHSVSDGVSALPDVGGCSV
jgi:hypothetical protein